jgi:2-phospho-L-lactate guanylyltransferase
MKLAVAVPMKPFALAKARLRPGLDDAARQKLAADMLRHVLAAVADSRVAEACGVVSADPAALAIAKGYGFEAIHEEEPLGYNAAAARASVWAQRYGCDALLILPADLPLITPEDIHNLTRLADARPQVVIIAPDAREEGTNALLLRPPDIIPPSFGLNSFHRHQQLVRTVGVDLIVHRSLTIAQDIDWIEDLQLFSGRK